MTRLRRLAATTTIKTNHRAGMAATFSFARNASICVLVLLATSVEGGDFDCSKNLGLSNSLKTIADADVSASVNSTEAPKARLNNPNGAWCFSVAQQTSGGVDFVYLQVDLKQPRLLSGFLSQGPPTSLFPATYFATANVELDLSDDGVRWTPCCPDSSPRQFLVSDDAQSADKVQTHSFGEHVGLIRAQYLRIKFKVNLVIMASHPDSLCFRFELMGCPTDFTPSVTLSAVPQPAGHIDFSWEPPKARIYSALVATTSGDPVFVDEPLVVDRYGFRYTLTINGNQTTVDVRSLPSTQYSIGSPRWGETYMVTLLCPVQNVSVVCWSGEVRAIVEDEQRRQDLTVSGPIGVTAHGISDSGVLLKWSYSDIGWLPNKYTVGLEGISGAQQDVSRSETKVKLAGLNLKRSFIVQFKPVLQGVSNPPLVFNGTISFIDISSQKANLVKGSSVAPESFGNYAALISSGFGLRLTTIWSGKLRLSWRSATAYVLDPSTETTSAAVIAQNYVVNLVELPPANISSSVTRNISVSALNGMYPFTTQNGITRTRTRSSSQIVPSANGTNSAEFPGIRMDTDYLATLSCSFSSSGTTGSGLVDCGSITVRTRPPTAVVTLGSSGKNSSIYDRKSLKISWSGAESLCIEEDGHLVSIATSEKEKTLISALPANLSEFWIGASVCVNRSGTNVWTDASPYAYFPLNSKTGLSKDSCCLKVQRNGNQASTNYVWLAESCGYPTNAICESKAPAGVISDIRNVTITKGFNNSAGIQWDVAGTFWEPSHVRVQFCRVEDMKPSAPYVPLSQMKACLNYTVSSADAEALALTTYLTRAASSTPTSPASNSTAGTTPTSSIQSTSTTASATTTKAPAQANSSAAMTAGSVLLPAANFMNATNLEDFVRYDVKVHGIVRGIVPAGPVTTLSMKTDPLKTIYNFVTPDGVTTLTWATFVKDGKGDTPVSASYRVSTADGNAGVTTVTGTAMKTMLGRLQWGATYIVTMTTDVGGKLVNDTFSFLAKPMCTSPEFQSGKDCFWVRQRLVLYTDTFALCREKTSSGLASLYNGDQEALATRLAARLKQDLWIVERTLRRKKRETEIALEEDVSTDVDVIGAAGPDKACWYIGAQSAQREQMTDCALARKFPLCSRSVAARTGMPVRQPGELNSFEVIRYAKAVKISWPWNPSSWISKFNVSLIKMSPPANTSSSLQMAGYTFARMKRQAVLVNPPATGTAMITKEFYQPPVVVEGLEEGVAYSADVTADFGGPAKEYSGSFLVPGEVNAGDINANATLEVIWLLVNGIMVGLMVIGLVAYLASGTFFLDALFQMGVLVSLLVAHLVLLIRPPYQFLQTTCEPLAHFLHFLFLCAAANMASETITVTLRSWDPDSLTTWRSRLGLISATIVVPTIMTGIMAGVKAPPGLVDQLQPVCWLYLEKQSFYVWWSAVPIGLCLALVIGLGLYNAISNYMQDKRPKNAHHQERTWMNDSITQRWANGLPLVSHIDLNQRYESYKTTRWIFWILTLVALLFGFTWSLGVATIQDNTNSALRVTFLIFCLVEGSAILTLRVGMDPQVNQGLQKHCCGPLFGRKEKTIRRNIPFVDGRGNNKSFVHPTAMTTSFAMTSRGGGGGGLTDDDYRTRGSTPFAIAGATVPPRLYASRVGNSLLAPKRDTAAASGRDEFNVTRTRPRASASFVHAGGAMPNALTNID